MEMRTDAFDKKLNPKRPDSDMDSSDDDIYEDPEKAKMTNKQKKYKELEEKMLSKMYSPPASEKLNNSQMNTSSVKAPKYKSMHSSNSNNSSVNES